MHAAERERFILQLLRQRGFISFQELDRQVEVSPATLRRDLEKLEHTGQIVRVRGGARLAGSEAEDVRDEPPRLGGAPFQQNVQRRREAKESIGRAAAGLCRHGESIIIDGGSTTLAMCPFLDGLELLVLSNSLHIIDALLPQQSTRIALPAGNVFREQNIILSPFDNDGMGRYRASRMFMGAASIGRHGVMQTDAILAQAERRLLERADELVLLVDSSKFEAPTGHVLCELSEIDVVVTDAEIRDEHKRFLEQAGIAVVVADQPIAERPSAKARGRKAGA
ncbi:DeoR/GlpR transcriptional regulator [Solimonas sp. K1W22B-7]|uniref:DeoR/GlpR family DNA-binding transcription regulator n=1 Tax=Solimonas sp. K1W22B-7 TaxID=2303331 RepID=UPI000E32F0A5|nr:DeoR/GlpR family DNA-binding transcription regulator [Solimonas sp. K1W22B-7]AXQ31266.1 DeoR/GlpR transcriptional regulator [Solimonas sp. K1W22B-7]